MLSKYEFVSYINLIQSGLEQRRRFDKAMSEFNTSFYVTNLGEDWLQGLICLLEVVMKDPPGKNGSYISWWLFGSDEVCKTLILTDEDGNDTELEVSTPEALYDYLTERKVD